MSTAMPVGSVDPATLASKIQVFVEEDVLPLEDEHDGDVAKAGGDALRTRLQAAAKEAGVFGPQVPVELGGHGLGMVDRIAPFEAAGRSLFGPSALNLNAPDEGNIHLLHLLCTASQRERFLLPLATGDIRSAFAMTEPGPGAGADPRALRTTATRVAGGWVIEGHKIFITGADGAAFSIVMARTSGEAGRATGATMFLVPADTPGVEIVRHVETVDRSMIGGHCEMVFDTVEVSDDQVLGEVDRGFQGAQLRLGPARMTHVMRWSGAARRAHEVALGYVLEREAFGGRLADLGMVHQLVADNEIDLAATSALLRTACEELDSGGKASVSTSIAKTFAAEALDRVADRATQLCGGMGVSRDLPVARIARELRPFRIYDGPSEVHRWSVARKALAAARRSAAPVTGGIA